MSLRIALLGGLSLELDGEPLEPPRAAGARELLAWLALSPGPQPRGELAARFWPDVLDESARQSLRNALWNLRRDLGPAADRVVLTRDTLELAGATEVDVRQLQAALAAGRVQDAVALAEAGELLRGLDQEWVLTAREDLGERVDAALAQLAQGAEDPAEAVAWARRRARLSPLSEAAVRDLMTRLDAAGDAAAALAVHDRFAQRLARELHAAPSAPTRELVADLRARAGEPVAPRAAGSPVRGPAAPAEPAHAAPAVAAPAPAPPAGAASAVAAAPRAAPDLLPRPLPLTGRAAEFGVLLGEWHAAREGAGGVVVLEGDPGAGKTRMAAELAMRVVADGGRAALGAATDLDGAAPLAPWAELLDALVEAPPAGAPWTGDLARLVPRLGPARQTGGDLDRLRLHEAVVAAVAAAAALHGPLLLVVEDVHAADAATLALTAHLGRRLGGLPVLLLITRRLAPPHAALDAAVTHLTATGACRTRLGLAPLRDTEAAALVRATAPLPPDAVARAVSAADGNALLAVETARALHAGHEGPPPTLRTLVQSLLAGLDADARAVAELLAVAGRGLEAAEVEALPVADPAGAACAAIAAGLLDGGEPLNFRHALLRDATQEAIPPLRRRGLCGAVADALQAAGRARPAELARLLRRAGRDAEAVAHLAAAARAARDVAALSEAGAFAREAIALQPEDPALRLLLAHVEALRGDHDAARAASEEGLRRIPHRDRRARGLALLERGSWLSSVLCWPAEALADFDAAAALIDTEPGLDDQRARLYAAWAWAHAVAGDATRVQGLLDRAHALSPPGTDGGVDMHVLSARVSGLVRQGRAREALALADELDALVRTGGWSHRLGDTSWLELSSIAAYVGEHEQALELMQRYLTVSGGLPVKRIEGLAGLAYVLARLGRGAEATAAAEEMAAVAEEIGSDELTALARHDLGMVLCEVGEHERGAALIDAALAAGAKTRTTHARLRRAESLIALGRLEEAAGDLRRTVLEPQRPADQPETLVPRVARVQGLLARARGEHERAAALLDEAAAGWARLGELDGRAAYLSNLVDLGRPPVAGLTEPARELARLRRERETLLHAELH